jgi:hypothetical protein
MVHRDRLWGTNRQSDGCSIDRIEDRHMRQKSSFGLLEALLGAVLVILMGAALFVQQLAR